MSDESRWPRGPKPWLKLWTNILDSEKVFSVTEALRWRYAALCAVTQRANLDGKVPNVGRAAFALRISTDEMQTTFDEFVRVGLLDRRAKSYWVHNWAHWQEGKSKAAERQKRYRDKRNALRNALRNGDVTGDVTVTPPLRNGSLAGAKRESERKKGNA